MPKRTQRGEALVRPVLTAAEKEAVEAVLRYFRQWAERGRVACEATGRSNPDGYDFRNAIYWRNVASGMKWADGVVKTWEPGGPAPKPFTLGDTGDEQP